MTAITLAVLGGCAAVAPKFYAPDLQPPAPAGDQSAGQPPLPPVAPWLGHPLSPALHAEVNNARRLQRRYSDVVQSFSDGTVGLGTALIGGGTVGAAKAATRIHPRDIAGLVAVLGGVYTWGNSLMPAGRVEAFQTGVVALDCAINATTALNEPGLRDAATVAQHAKGLLDVDVLQLKVWQRPVKETSLSGGPTAGCNRPLSCDASSAKCAEARKSYGQLCAPARVNELSIPAHPDVEALLPQAEDLRRRIAAGLPAAARYLVQMDLAADDLRGRVRGIEAAVIAEAAKSQPNLSTIKTAAANSAEAGAAFIPLPKTVTQPSAPVPAPAPAQDAGKALSSSTATGAADVVARVQQRPSALDDLRARVLLASQAWDSLQFTLVAMESRLQRALAMEACSVRGATRPMALMSADPLRAGAADVLLNDDLRKRLAPLLGVDPKSPSLIREVDEALRDCHARGLIDDPASGTLASSSVLAVTLGQCRKGGAS